MCIRDREWPALIFAYLRPEQSILGLIREDDDDEIRVQKTESTDYLNGIFKYLKNETVLPSKKIKDLGKYVFKNFGADVISPLLHHITFIS